MPQTLKIIPLGSTDINKIFSPLLSSLLLLTVSCNNYDTGWFFIVLQDKTVVSLHCVDGVQRENKAQTNTELLMFWLWIMSYYWQAFNPLTHLHFKVLELLLMSASEKLILRQRDLEAVALKIHSHYLVNRSMYIENYCFCES